jgi:hypothetical protein
VTDTTSNSTPELGQAKDQFAWLRQVAYDRGLPQAASRVAAALTKYFNYRDHDGWAWMSQDTIALDLGVTDRTVRQALSDLVKRGHLIAKRRGMRETNLYHLALKNEESDRKESSSHDRKEPSDHDRKNPSAQSGVTGKNTSSDRKNPVKVTGSVLPPNPTNEPNEVESDSPRFDLGEDSRRRPGQKTTDEIDDSFEEWWKQVPRKVAKTAAAKTFRRIVEKREATVDQLLAGIIRYAGEVANREERYIAHPGTWLSQGRWQDEPAKPAGDVIDSDGNPVAAPPPYRPPPQWGGRESNTERLQRKLQQGGVR